MAGLKPQFLSRLFVEEIDYKYNRLTDRLVFYSAHLKCLIIAPKGFVNVWESVPGMKGTSTYSGVIHDLVSRSDFRIVRNGKPVAITKHDAAMVYNEALWCRYRQQNSEMPSRTVRQKIKKQWNRADRFCRRKLKVGVVRVWPGYWHRFTVMATYEEIRGADMGISADEFAALKARNTTVFRRI